MFFGSYECLSPVACDEFVMWRSGEAPYMGGKQTTKFCHCADKPNQRKESRKCQREKATRDIKTTRC